MERNIDELLKEALAPTEEPDYWLNQKIIQSESRKGMKCMKRTKRLSIAVGAMLFFCVSVTSVYGAYRYFSPSHVAQTIKDDRLAKAFESKDAVVINKTQKSSQFNVSLLGMVSGKNLTKFAPKDNKDINIDRTYCVVAIERSDGTKFKKEYYEDESFLVSPFIQGYKPHQINAFSLDGGYTEFVEDGILYRLLECDNIEKFANKTIYLGVLEGDFYDNQAYCYDEESGKITPNKEFEGLNALFTLPIDKSKADENAVKEFESKMIKEGTLEKDSYSSSTEYIEGEDGKEDKIIRKGGVDVQSELADNLTPENLEQYAEKIEGQDKILKPEDGYISYSYEIDDSSSKGTAQVEALFPDGKTGMSSSFSLTTAGENEDTIIIEAFTLQSDGKILLELYRVKE